MLGLGAGWNETEYRAFGLPYDHRVSRFEESFEIVRRTARRRARDARRAASGRRTTPSLLPRPTRADAADDRLERRADARGRRCRTSTAGTRGTTGYGNTVEGFAELNARDRARGRGAPAATRRRSTRSACVLVELEPDAVKRPHSDAEQSEPGDAGRSRRAARALEEAGADEAILILRPITEASIRAVSELFCPSSSSRDVAPAPGCRRRSSPAGRPSSRPRRRRRTPPRRSRSPGRGSRRRRSGRRGGSSGPSISSWRRSVRPMKLSFVVTTQGAMKTSSSSVEYAVM